MSAKSRSLTIVITGASRGLGAGMARTYLERGHKIAGCSRSPPPEDLDDTVSDKEGRLYYQSNVDVCDPQAVKGFLENTAKKLGPDIDVWINNAGILDPIKPIRDTNFADFEKNIQINLMGTFHATKAYINYCRSRAGDATTPSTLVNISSGAAVKGYAGWGAYCSSKGAVDRLTECALAEEQDDESSKLCFRAYSIAPGVIDTDMQTKIRSAAKSDFPMVDKFHEIKANDSFNTPPYIAIEIERLALLEGPQTLAVVQRLPSKKS
jgi:benzil reductase ((S)-benzoin forming)